MAYSKDIERLARSLHGQKLERAYIVHYLMECFQISEPAALAVLARVGIPVAAAGKGSAPPGFGKEVKTPSRQNFY